jgi:hypothetical protein
VDVVLGLVCGRVELLGGRDVWVGAFRGGVAHQGSRGCEWVMAGSAAEACIRAGRAHDGIVGHGRVGLNQLIDREGHADLRVRNLVVSEPHAASVCVRQRISPSRRPK